MASCSNNLRPLLLSYPIDLFLPAKINAGNCLELYLLTSPYDSGQPEARLTIGYLRSTMELTTLSAISSIDGRYRKQVQHLDDYFSEYALIKYRVLVEMEYLFFLSKKNFVNYPTKRLNISIN